MAIRISSLGPGRCFLQRLPLSVSNPGRLALQIRLAWGTVRNSRVRLNRASIAYPTRGGKVAIASCASAKTLARRAARNKVAL